MSAPRTFTFHQPSPRQNPTIRAIQTTFWGQPPTSTTSAPTPPALSSSEVRIRVLASGLHRLTRSLALGTHYSAQGQPLPYTPVSDGVGTTLEGKLVYFSAMPAGGAWAEEVNVSSKAVYELKEGADAVQIAGLFNPGMSSWMALKTGVSELRKDFTIVILGVTTQSGRVAAIFARRLGAKRVIGVGRNEKKMEGLGLDEAIVLKEDLKETEWEEIAMRWMLC